jgi:hypothetical protein
MAYGHSFDPIYTVSSGAKAVERRQLVSPDHVESFFTVWSKRAGLVLLGWFLSSAYHNNFELDRKAAVLEHVQKVDIPKLKAERHCEEVRGDRAAAVAGQAILSNTFDAVRTPSTKEIPPDNCPHLAK